MTAVQNQKVLYRSTMFFVVDEGDAGVKVRYREFAHEDPGSKVRTKRFTGHPARQIRFILGRGAKSPMRLGQANDLLHKFVGGILLPLKDPEFQTGVLKQAAEQGRLSA